METILLELFGEIYKFFGVCFALGILFVALYGYGG